ncbi:MAG: hypothetical protein VXW32_04035 [Myxococcota bacterium]|jgi:hypothetical protein|nr:hypothetical protein [Myxococcota bacterium]
MLHKSLLEALVDIVTAYLNTPLYSPEGEQSIPAGAVALSGNLVSRDSSGIHLQASTYRNLRGKELEGSPTTLFIPLHKIDHVQFAD